MLIELRQPKQFARVILRTKQMKLYGINFFCNYKTHSEEIWAVGRYELEKQILSQYPKATGIYIWLI